MAYTCAQSPGQNPEPARSLVLGASATVPHKVAAMPLLDEISATARRAGAVNTIVNREGQLFGDNTDSHGFRVTVAEVLGDSQPPLALVLGAGGAARAVVLALEESGIPEIVVANRDAQRAAKLAADLTLAPARPAALTEDSAGRGAAARRDAGQRHVAGLARGRDPDRGVVARSPAGLLRGGGSDLSRHGFVACGGGARITDGGCIAHAGAPGGEGVHAVDGTPGPGGDHVGGSARRARRWISGGISGRWLGRREGCRPNTLNLGDVGRSHGLLHIDNPWASVVLERD